MVPPALPTVWVFFVYGCAEQASRLVFNSEPVSEAEGWICGAWLGPRLSSAVEQATATERAAMRARPMNLRGHFVIHYSR
jgi:GTP-dependent phosphoenolpyruvate carboxykinase